MWSADRSADRSRGGGLPQKQMRDNENSSRASDRICTNILEASPRAMSKCDFVEITKYGSRDSLACSLPGRSNCRAANATISCTPPARARFGLKQLRPVASRCSSSTTLPLQHLLTSQHVCILGHPPLHVPCTCNKAAFWLKPSAWTAADMHKTILLPLWSCCHEAPLSPEGDF